MIPFQAAIFDLDGTLLDSMHVWKEVDLKFLSRRGLPYEEDFLQAMSTLDFSQGAAYTIERYGLNETPEMLMQEWHQLAVDAYTHQIELKPHAREYLAELREAGISLAIATASTPELFEPCLKRHGIDDWFEVIAYSAEVQRSKAYPDLLRLTAGRLRLRPEQCIFFEDILLFIETAKTLRMQTVGVYDPHQAENWLKMQKTADYAIESFADAPGPGSGRQPYRENKLKSTRLD